MFDDAPYEHADVTLDTSGPVRVDLTDVEAQHLREAVAGIVAATQTYLPEGFVVGSELVVGQDGPAAMVAVHPPAGPPISAGFAPDAEELASGLTPAATEEVAKGLAASAALQAMVAVGDDLVPTAR
jgi:hypothetical protein